MYSKTAVVLGASGLTGSHLLSLLLEDDHFERVRALVRTPLDRQHPKLETAVVNFDDLEDLAIRLGNGDSIFCCVGTTQKKIRGDPDAYRKVDFAIPFNAARLGIALGFRKFLLVSTVGADAASPNFYLRLKGETEKNIRLFDYDSIHIFRPSVLLGARKEFRWADVVGNAVFRPLSLLFFGPFKKYRAVNARTLAAAMLGAAKKDVKGVYVWRYPEFKALGSDFKKY